MLLEVLSQDLGVPECCSGQAECASDVSIPSGVSLTSLALSNWFVVLSLVKSLHISEP